MNFSLTLRDVDEEKERAIRQLFERNGWTYDAQRLPHQTSRKRGRYPVIVVREHQSSPSTRGSDARDGGETSSSRPGAAQGCPHCLQAPCITTGGRDLEFIGDGQAPCPQNRSTRNNMYKRYWKILEFVGLWREKRYLERKIAVGNGEWVLYHRRELMPTCVVQKVRRLYPNPQELPYVCHQWN